MARFLFESGCSISEAAAIRNAALSADGTLELGERTVIIAPDLASELKTQAGEYLFSTRQAATITPKRIQQILKPYITRVHKGKNTPHVLRYTHVVHAYKQGVPIRSISSQTGLSAVRIAQIVADVPPPRRYSFQSPLKPLRRISARRASEARSEAKTRPVKQPIKTIKQPGKKINETTIERARKAAEKKSGESGGRA
jgi:integrase